jgi:hypothetical protein
MHINIGKNLKNYNRLTMVSFDFPWKGIRRDGFYKYLLNYIK